MQKDRARQSGSEGQGRELRGRERVREIESERRRGVGRDTERGQEVERQIGIVFLENY